MNVRNFLLICKKKKTLLIGCILYIKIILVLKGAKLH